MASGSPPPVRHGPAETRFERRVIPAHVGAPGAVPLLQPHGMLAAGYCDLVIEAALKPHDFIALVPVIQGAGGRISDWNGAALNWDSGDRVVAAATPALWEQAVAALTGR